MKKPKVQIVSAPPHIVQRADLAPSTGYALVVDGHFKTEFGEEKAANRIAGKISNAEDRDLRRIVEITHVGEITPP